MIYLLSPPTAFTLLRNSPSIPVTTEVDSKLFVNVKDMKFANFKGKNGVETTEMSFSVCMVMPTLVHPYNGEPLNNLKRMNYWYMNNLDESPGKKKKANLKKFPSIGVLKMTKL